MVGLITVTFKPFTINTQGEEKNFFALSHRVALRKIARPSRSALAHELYPIIQFNCLLDR